MMCSHVSDLVVSLAGRDKDEILLVLREDETYLWLANGRTRRAEKPKRKKKKHVQPTFYVEKDVAAKLQTGEYLLDADIKKALKKYQQVRDV